MILKWYKVIAIWLALVYQWGSPISRELEAVYHLLEAREPRFVPVRPLSRIAVLYGLGR